ncbi:hypothetical protein [Dickeya zeae]|uniref:hypothetical protein n=1 Tax=Dickeya zeae TaxID=204042 RepID=UPI0020675089|nr:hypothetical protein [Dickeya zeae]UPT57224.1 hypothetical protein FGI00_17485 [Dickeya zeae]
MIISPFGFIKVAPSRPCCEPTDGDRAGRTCGRNTVKDQQTPGICSARKALAPGTLLVLAGCGHQARGVAVPPSGFTTTQGRMALPPPKGTMANAPDRHNGVTDSPRQCQPHAVPMTGDSTLPHRATAEVITRRSVVARLPAYRPRRLHDLTAVDHQCRGRCTATQPSAAHHGESQRCAE